MCVYLRTEFQGSNIILRSFRRAVVLPPPTAKQTPENPTQIRVKSVLIPKLLNNPLASCSLINLDFLLSRTAPVDKINSFLLFVFTILWIFLSAFCLHLKQYDNVFL